VKRRSAAWLYAALVTLACNGHESSVVPSEPIQVTWQSGAKETTAQFVRGALPGEPQLVPVDGGLDGGVDAGLDAGSTAPAAASRLAIDANSRPFGALVPGAAHQQYAGLVTQDAAAIGVAFDTLGSGYWVVPVAGPDPMYPGKVAWTFYVNFNSADDAGQHELRMVALDDAGSAGTQIGVPVCIDSSVPDNDHACIPDLPPPATVISLRWDDNFDLDLHVVTPSGADLSARNPAGAALDGGIAPDAIGAAVDRDALRNCVFDGFRREDLIFKKAPSPGAYKIYVEPFAACGQASARFTVSVYTLTGTCPTCALEPTFSQSGELLAMQVTGGTNSGLFIHELELPQGL
jgi:hypothetical protein